MGLFCGKTCQCKRRCKSWFSGTDSLLDACKAACKGDNSLTRERFLCSGNYVDQQNIILQYGYDPCLNDDVTFESTLQIEDQWENLRPIMIVLVILLFGALAIFYIKKS